MKLARTSVGIPQSVIVHDARAAAFLLEWAADLTSDRKRSAFAWIRRRRHNQELIEKANELRVIGASEKTDAMFARIIAALDLTEKALTSLQTDKAYKSDADTLAEIIRTIRTKRRDLRRRQEPPLVRASGNAKQARNRKGIPHLHLGKLT